MEPMDEILHFRPIGGINLVVRDEGLVIKEHL